LLFDDASRSAIDLEAQHWPRIFAGNEILDVSAQELDLLFGAAAVQLHFHALFARKRTLFFIPLLIFRLQKPSLLDIR
jgi:hypothetical protein